MKKALKIYGWAWLALIVTTIVTIAVMIIYPSHHKLAANPYSIEKIVKVDLPDIASVKTMDDGGGFRWDMFVHKGRFIEEISEESIEKMDELCISDSMHWRKNRDEESEGIFVLFALMVAYMILLTSGIILLIIRLFRRKK